MSISLPTGTYDVLPLLMLAIALTGLINSMTRMPRLKTWTPPPDMYSMKAFMGNDFAGEMARSQARLSLSSSYF